MSADQGRTDPVRDLIDGVTGPTAAATVARRTPAATRLRPVGSPPAGAAEPPGPRLTRSRDGRIVGGVAAGIATHLHASVLWVRIVFCVLGLLSGVGVLAYALLWMMTPLAAGPDSDRPPTAAERRQAIGIAAVGAALAVIGVALGFGNSVGWVVGPLGLAAVGAAFIWREADDARRERWRRNAVGVVGQGAGAAWRLAGGIALVVGGLGVFALGQFDFSAAGSALLAVVLTLVGVAVIGIPWWIRLLRDLGAERREVVAQQERAEIAAHLHDSVLQTLALIQRQSSDPREVLRLSRSQERELRTWLYGPAGYASAGEASPSGDTLAAALAHAAGEVEDTYAVKVTPVVVGDAELNSDLNALVAAAREAMVNAAKHAGTPDISLYAEVEDGSVSVFVKDRGVGFDPSQVGPDRRGLAQSIRGRMDRHGGQAVLRSTPGEGTEVELTMKLPSGPEAVAAVAPAAGPEAAAAVAPAAEPAPVPDQEPGHDRESAS